MSDELERFRLDGRVAVVSGGSGGIGVRLCAALAGVGARAGGIGRDASRASAALDQAGGDGIAVAADVTIKEEADHAIDARPSGVRPRRRDHQRRRRRRRRGAVPGRGVPGDRVGPDARPQPALGAAADPGGGAGDDRRRNGGRVLHLSSVRGQLGIDNGFSAYVAAKGALDALTRQQATEWAKHAITVNAISPTFVRRRRSRTCWPTTRSARASTARIPLGRIAETDDVVGAVLLLCSDASAFITGQVLTLDGGLTACQ